MEKIQFYEAMQDQIQKRVCDGEVVKMNQIWKNNGVKQMGISILPKGMTIAPTVYLEEFYKKYQAGKSLEELADQFLEIYEKSRLKTGIDASFFTDYEKVKDRIVFKLVNGEKNRELLAEIPHRTFMDLEMVFYYIWDDRELERATVLIKNSHLEMWGVTAEQLRRTAKRNSERLLPVELVKMENLIRSMFGSKGNTAWIDSLDTQMYVLTNTSRLFGAASLLYDNVVREFAFTCGKNMYIIPSSVHEVILLPDEKGIKAEMLNQMVREVNMSQLDEKEFLSDHVYYYDYEDDILTACVGG